MANPCNHTFRSTQTRRLLGLLLTDGYSSIVNLFTGYSVCHHSPMLLLLVLLLLQANIKEPRFDLDYFKGFDIVLNGLDNMDARRHVNRLCVAAGVPLVESGTAGFLGQVRVHVFRW